MIPVFNVLSLIALSYLLFLQISNFIKYRKTNGANKERIVLITYTVFMFIHVVRLMLGYTIGIFMFLSVVCFLVLYGGLPLIKKKASAEDDTGSGSKTKT